MTTGKNNFRLLLLSPPYPRLGGEELFGLSGREEWFPLGIFALANAIRMKSAAEVQIYYHPDYTPAALGKVIRQFKPDLVGITCFTNTRFACFELVSLIKGIDPKIKTLLGGVHATFLDQQIMENYPQVDFIIRGYAEGAFMEVIEAIKNNGDFARIAGLTWRRMEKVQRNCNRSLENDLNWELTPDIESLFIGGLPVWKSMHMILFSLPVETARGCVYTCFFCSRIGPENRTVVDRDPAQSLRYVHGFFKLFGRREVYFCDTNFTINRKRVFEFCKLLRQENPLLEWTCSTRVDLVDREILMEMKAAGCRKIYYGVDSLCAKMLPAIGRNFTPETAVRNLNLTVDCGLEVEANIIIGFPGETAETFLESYGYRNQLHPKVQLVVRPLKIMPGGPLYHHAIKEGFKESYWLEDHGCEFPNYTGAMSEKRILEYCRILRSPKKYLAAEKQKLIKA